MRADLATEQAHDDGGHKADKPTEGGNSETQHGGVIVTGTSALAHSAPSVSNSSVQDDPPGSVTLSSQVERHTWPL
jgi:hypothetical protein